jgi:hypothetical protein
MFFLCASWCLGDFVVKNLPGHKETTKHQTLSVVEVAVHVLSEAEGKNLHLCLEDSSLTIVVTPIKIRLMEC